MSLCICIHQIHIMRNPHAAYVTCIQLHALKQMHTYRPIYTYAHTLTYKHADTHTCTHVYIRVHVLFTYIRSLMNMHPCLYCGNTCFSYIILLRNHIVNNRFILKK